MAEAVGLALAVAPLIISAAEHYRDAADCIKRYRKHTKLVMTLVQELNVQQAIFRAANVRLLSHAVDPDCASQMLASRTHPSWTDAEVARLYVARLGDSRQAILDAVWLIDHLLTSLGNLFGSLTDVQSDTISQNGSQAKDSVKKKIKLAFKGAEIRSSLDELMRKTQAFSILVTMTEPESPQARRFPDKLSPSTQKKVTQCAKIKDAAENLYQALGYACTKHSQHQAHLNLRPTCSDSSQVRFTIAFRQLALRPKAQVPAHSPDPTWLTVESSISGIIQYTGDVKVLTQLQDSMKRLRETSPPDSKPAKSKKSVTFACASPTTASRTITQPATPSSLPNLCQNSNFCNQLQKIAIQVHPGTNRCIGYLEHSGSSKHLVYVDSRIQTISPTPALSNSMTSLGNVLKQTQDAKFISQLLPQYERIRLAKQLALGVLQFHATPWLHNAWTSEDVLITAGLPDTHSGTTNAYDSYLNICISSPHNQLKRTTTFPSRTLIRNRLLFSLGVILLELACQKPLRQMQEVGDVDQHEGHNTDYYTANRVSLLASDLGTRYAEIARKCIQCDFGFGDDLSNRSLQEGFYQAVVAELERLEACLA